MATILCIDHHPLTPQLLRAQLAEENPGYDLALALTTAQAAAQIETLGTTHTSVPLVIARQGLIDSAGIQTLYRWFPQALTVLLLESTDGTDGGAIAALIPSGQLYRCLRSPWTEADLQLTVTEALRRYHYEQQLAQMQAQLMAAQQQPAERGDRQTADLAPPEDQLFFQQLTKNLPGVVHRYVRHADGTDAFTYVSSGCEALFGLKAEALLTTAQALWDLVHPEDVPMWIAHVAHSAQHPEETFQGKCRITTPDGELKWLEVKTSVPQQLANGDLVWYGFMHDITQHQQTQLELRRNRELLEAVFNQSSDGLFLVDTHTRLIVDCNDRAVELFQAETKASLIGIQGNQLQRQPFTEAELTEARQIIAEHGFWSAEVEYVSLKGNLFWGNLATNLITVTGSAMMLVRVSDISDRKRIEAALRASEQHRQLALELTHTGSWEFEVASGQALWSDSHYHLMGLTPGIHPSNYATWCQAVHPDDLAQAEQAFAQALDTHSLLDVEYRVVWPNGDERWVLTRGQGIYNDSGQPIKMMGVMVDISDRKRIEAALQQSQEQLQIALKFGRIGLWNWDACANQLTWNDIAYQLIGLEPRAEPLTHDRWFQTIHPDDRAAVQQEIDQAIGAGRTFQHEYRVLLPDGTQRWIADSGQGIYSADGELLRMAGAAYDITPRKTAELALQQLNDELEQRVQQRTQELQKLAAIVENSTDLIGTASLSGDTLYLNQAGQRLIGRSAASIINTPIVNLHNPAAVTHLVEEALPTALNQGCWRGESTLRHHQTGEDIVVEQVIFLIRDSNSHEPLCLATICRDMRDRSRLDNERQRAAIALRQSEERFRGIFEQAAMGIVEADLNGRIVQANQKFCDLVGYSAPELASKTYLDLTHPDDMSHDNANVQRLLSGEISTFMMEKRYLRSDQAMVWVSLAVSLVQDGLGQPRYLLGVVNDISDRKQAEQALQESRTMLQLVLDTVPLRIFWKDRYSRFLGCNYAFANDFNLTPEQIIGKTDLELPWAAYAEDYRRDDVRVMTTQIPELGYEELTNNANDEETWIRTSKVPISNAEGDIIGVLGCYEDISDRKQVEASLQTLNQELEQRVQERTQALQQATEIAQSASQAKSTFLANMSHELRTPLNAILGFSQLMARDHALSPSDRQSLEIINRSGEHLLDLINDILEMAKIEAGQVSFNPLCFDLDILLNTLAELFHLRASTKGLKLIIDRHPALPCYLSSDQPKLRQVLINLLGNAIKFTDSGQVCLRVTPVPVPIDCLAPGTNLAIAFAVSDTGIGIAAENLDCLLDPFVQITQRTRVHEGTGLGLSISRQFVQLLGGTLTVESQLGQGSTFAFTLPMQVVDRVDDAELSPALPPITQLAPGQPPYRILVADDDRTHRHLLTQLLRSVGFEVWEARDGQEALALWLDCQPQLIWLDMRMPILSGDQVARHIRTQTQAANLPAPKIIALTANAFEEDRAQALSVGCDDFVRKPFQLNHVLVKIAEHLGVQYTYDSAPVAIAAEPMSTTAAIAALRALPSSAIAQLYDATLKLDSEQLAQLANQFPPSLNALADLIHRHLDSFAFDTIHDLIQQAMDS
ncbi:PAS domain S-box protein [Nodosilinea sp. E11]|uniref:PAS domain S-box protein n=1 Tax=Nodosilinea sp. E11 TaxID=3037479 RepID=UPI002934285F|nr:PAS domain S-box protein [Nodosilinea sp. E11]WOD40363.1 PAS domain S-box protein [Nodosilinea sp. E11]